MQKEKSLSSGTKPFVSVIMPVYNEAAFIKRSLGAILEQSYPHNLMEIIIADGMSTDNTRELIAEMGGHSRIPITIVDNPKKIAPTGLNQAIKNSKGEIIVRVDGHCEVAPTYVENCVRHLQNGEAEGVGGPIQTIGETPQARAIAVVMSSSFGVGGSAFRTVFNREMYVDTVAFPGYKKKTIENVGLFNEELVRNQDDEFNYRIRKSGGRILLSPDIQSRYYSRSTFWSLWRQYFQYGYWKVRVLQLHPKQMSLRQFIPFLFVTSLISTGLLSLFFSEAKWLFAGILTIYFFTTLTATILLSKKIELLALPYIFLSFTILHFSYGLGFVFGLSAFWSKWNFGKKKENAGW